MTLCFLQGIELHVIPFLCFLISVAAPEQVQFPSASRTLCVMAVRLQTACAAAAVTCCRFTPLLQTNRSNDTFNSVLHFLPLGIRIMWHWPTVLITTCVTLQVVSSSGSYWCSLVVSVFFPSFSAVSMS